MIKQAQNVAIVKEQNVDFILAVGGGSVIDGSKYVAASAKYMLLHGHVWGSIRVHLL